MNNIMQKSLALLAAGLLVVSTAAHAGERKPANNGYKGQKVVYHINNAEVAFAGLRNVMNHLNAVGDENVKIVVVTHGQGIDFLLTDWKDKQGRQMGDAVHELAGRGVKFQICANTLSNRKIDESRINLNADITPSGVATVGELQHEGYVYVKP